MSGSKADADTANAPDYAEFERLSNRAESQGRIGVIASASGGALLLTGIIWYATHRAKHEQTTISGWLDPSGGGLAASGRF